MAQIKLVPGEGTRDHLEITLQPESGNVVTCGQQLHEAALDDMLRRELSDVEYAFANAVNECFDGFHNLEDAGMRLRVLTGLIESFRLNYNRWSQPD